MAVQDWSSSYHLSIFAKLQGPDQGTLTVLKNLAEENPILDDMLVLPANDTMSDTDARQSYLPTPQIVDIGETWSSSVSSWTNFVETISKFVDSAVVSADILDTIGDPVKKRIAAVEGHTEGFGQGVCNHLIYGTSIAAPKKFDGLDVRYTIPDSVNPINPSSAGDYGVWNAGKTGDATTSFWLIQHGEQKVHMIHPKFRPNRGVKVWDAGKVYVTDSNGKHRWDYITELEFYIGLKVKDYRAVQRIRNITTDFSSTGGLTSDVSRLIIQARNYFRGTDPVFLYCSRAGFNAIDILSTEKGNVKYSDTNPWGKPMLMFRDMPVRMCDAILDTEPYVAPA